MTDGAEVRVCGKPVDGFHSETQRVLQFHGCEWHGHEHLWVGADEEKRRELQERRQKTQQTTDMFRRHGYEVTEKWECDFRNDCKRDAKLTAFIHTRQPQYFQQTRYSPQSIEEVLTAVETGVLYGVLEVDISVPEQWQSNFKPSLSPREYFEEFPPLFCTTSIPYEIIGETMQNYVKEQQKQEHLATGGTEHNFVFKEPPARRLMVGALQGERLLLGTPLLQWYLAHGLVVTRVYQVIEFQPSNCFRSFIDDVTDTRRQADIDPDLAILADIAKLTNNASFGSFLLDRLRHSDVTYVRGKGLAANSVKDPLFKNMTEVSDGLFEIQKNKKSIRMDIPNYVGLWYSI